MYQRLLSLDAFLTHKSLFLLGPRQSGKSTLLRSRYPEALYLDLRVGGLPSILDSAIAWEELKAYVGTYLREEIQAEGAARSIENFSRFLDFAAHFSGEQMNFTALGSDAGIPPRTVKDYVSLLEDTLIGHVLEPYREGRRRKAVATSKFYLFDVGVTNALLGRKSVERKTADRRLRRTRCAQGRGRRCHALRGFLARALGGSHRR